MFNNGITKNFAVFNSGNSEYLKDAYGNVYKFIFGKDCVNISYNYIKKVGKVSTCKLPNDFESNLYNGFAPIRATLYPIKNKSNLFVWEH